MSKKPIQLRLRLLPVLISTIGAVGCATVGSNPADLVKPLPSATSESPAGATSRAGAATTGVAQPKGDTANNVDFAQMSKGTGVLLNAPSKTGSTPGSGNISLNFEAADIRDIAKTVLAEILKESYVVDPKVGGSISFRTTTPLPKDALLPTLETILRMNGVVMVKENGIFKLMPSGNAKGSLSPRLGGALAGYSIQIIPLQYVSAVEMVKLLEPFVSDPSAVRIDELRNLLIVSGTQNEIQHVLDTVNVFDADWLSGMSIGLFTLKNSDVKAVSSEIDKILGDKGLNPLAGLIRIIPLERLNAFVVISPQAKYLDQAKLWLERLDAAAATGGTQLHVYHIQNSKAEYLADLLNQTFASKSQASATTRPTNPSTSLTTPGRATAEIKSSSLNNKLSSINGAGTTTATASSTSRATPSSGATLSITDDSGTASDVRVVADRENNALLILASSAAYEKIESALRKLDVAPRQVLIEVTIAEVTLTDDLEYGVEWAFSKGSRKSGRLTLDENTTVDQIAKGFSYALTNVTGDALKAVFNALATDKKLNVLSSPHIMVADNQTAKIQVGQSVPTQTSTTTSVTSATSNAVTSTIQYVDTGVMLAVTPRINAGGLVSLDIAQEVSEVDTNGSASNIDSPTIFKRMAQTIVTIQNGETLVLGGLISENNNKKSSGIPFLSEIPILGAAFGKQSRNSTKTELVLLITPRVASNVAQAKDISDELQRKMGETKNLIDCGTSNILGFTTRGGPWCMQARRNDGAIDKMKLEDENGVSVYLKDEAKLEQENARRALDEVNRQKAEAQQRLEAATKRVEQTQRSSGKADSQASKPAATSATGDAAATATANKATTENTARKTPAPGKPKAKVVVPREPGVKAAPATPVVTPVESKAQATPPEVRDEPAPVVDPAQAVPAPASPE